MKLNHAPLVINFNHKLLDEIGSDNAVEVVAESGC